MKDNTQRPHSSSNRVIYWQSKICGLQTNSEQHGKPVFFIVNRYGLTDQVFLGQFPCLVEGHENYILLEQFNHLWQ